MPHIKKSAPPFLEILEFRELLSGVATDYVLEGDKWPTHALTYSIAPDGSNWNGTTDDLNGTMGADLGPDWAAQIDRALAFWSGASNLTFTRVPDSTPGDIRIGGYRFADTSTLAVTYSPAPGVGGDVTLDTAEPWHNGSDYDLSSVLTHELGHALGLAHASDPGDVMFPKYQGYVTGLGAGDIAGIQALYGPPGVAPAISHLPPPTVFDHAPMVNAGVNATVTAGQAFGRVGNFADPDPDTWTGMVDYGDGVGNQPLPLNPDHSYWLYHAYAAPGDYTVAVTVNDSQGGQGRGFFAVHVAAPTGGQAIPPVVIGPPVQVKHSAPKPAKHPARHPIIHHPIKFARHPLALRKLPARHH